jgi:hypothetical protein
MQRLKRPDTRTSGRDESSRDQENLISLRRLQAFKVEIELDSFAEAALAVPALQALIRVKDQLPAVKSLGATGCRSAFNASDSMHGLECVTRKPVLCRLGFEVFQE